MGYDCLKYMAICILITKRRRYEKEVHKWWERGLIITEIQPEGVLI